MEMEIWEKIILSWVNSLGICPRLKNISQLKTSIMTGSEHTQNSEKTLIDFINDIFPNSLDNLLPIISTDFDYLCAATVFLIYVSFSNKSELDALRQSMCLKLENSVQTHIADFLMSVQKQGDVFKISINEIKGEIFKFVQSYSSPQLSMSGDGIKTPMTPVSRSSQPKCCDSPLMEFFQTPKRKSDNKKHRCSTCCDGDRLKQIRDQLVEEELEKSSLQEKLNKRINKCSDYEMKLKDKIDEIRQLRRDWDNDSKKNDDKINSLSQSLEKRTNDEKHLKNEISSLERYVSVLEADLRQAAQMRAETEKELTSVLEKCGHFEMQAREASEENSHLKTAIYEKEHELLIFREHYMNAHDDEKSIDTSYMDERFNVTPSVPESMDIVVKEILREENEKLKDTIEELSAEKTRLLSDISTLQDQFCSQKAEMSIVEALNKELEAKCEEFDKVVQELFTASEKLANFSKENQQLKEKTRHQSTELTSCNKKIAEYKKSNESLKIDVKKLTEDFQNAQKDIEKELQNVSRLTLETEEKHLKLKKSMETLSEVQLQHEAAQKRMGFVEAHLSKNVGKLEGLLKDSESEEKSTESFTSCFSVENKLDKLTDLLGKLEVHNLETAESRACLEKTCIQLNESIVSLKTEICELEDKQRSSLKERQELEECLQRAEEKISDLQEVYSSKINLLKEELVEKVNKITELDNFIYQSKQNQENLLSEKEILCSELEKLKNQCSEAKATIKKLESQLASSENDHTAQVSAMNDELGQLKKILDALNKKNALLSAAANEKGKKLSDSFEEMKQLQEAHKIALQEKKNLIAEKDSQINSSKGALKKLKNQISSLETELNKTAQEKSELKKHREKEAHKIEALLNEKKTEISSLTSSIDKLNKQVKKLNNEKDQLGKELQKTSQEVDVLKSSRDKKEKELTDAVLTEKETICALNNRVAVLEENIENVEEEKRKAIDEIQKLLDKLRQWEEEKSQLEASNKEHKSQYQLKLNELNRLESELLAFKAKYEKKEEELNQISLDKGTLEKTVKTIDSKNRELTEKLDSTKEELEKMKEQNKVLSSSNEACQENIEKQQREMEALFHQSEILRSKYTQLEEEKENVEKQLQLAQEELDSARRDLSLMASNQQKTIDEAEDKIRKAEIERNERLEQLRDIQRERDEIHGSLMSKDAELTHIKTIRDALLEENQVLAARSKETAEKAAEKLESITGKLNEEISKRSVVELQLSEEKKSIESLTSEVQELEDQREKIRRLGHEMKSNVTILKILLNRDLLNPSTNVEPSKELQVIYDSCKEITESASQFSVGDEVERSDYFTVTDGHPSQESAHITNSTPSSDVNEDDAFKVAIEMEELNQEIITAKKSLIAYLQASMKHFEVLKIKENLVNEMSKQQQNLENRITSLTELNARLTKEIIESKNISKIETEYKEQELDNLKLEVESLQNTSQLLKDKLTNLEKVNEVLIAKKEESTSQVAILREKNKALNNDIQNRVMTQLRQQDSCWGLIRSKQETELELERALTAKNSLEKRIGEVRKTISKHQNRSGLEILLSAAEQKFYIASQKLLYATYSCLKWTEKNIEHQCLLIGQGNEFKNSEAQEISLRNEQKVIRDKLTSVLDLLTNITESVNGIEGKCASPESDDLSDSLEEVSVSNKTFEIINLEEKLNDRTFSIQTEVAAHNKKFPKPIDKHKVNAMWVVSPPSKQPKEAQAPGRKERTVHGETWVVPLDPVKPKTNKLKENKFRSVNDLTSNAQVKAERASLSSMSKSSSFSSITEIDFSPPSKRDQTSSFHSLPKETDVKKEPEKSTRSKPEDETFLIDTQLSKSIDSKLNEISQHFPTSDKVGKHYEELYRINESVMKEKLGLEKKIGVMHKEMLQVVKERENLKLSLSECEQKRRKEKDAFEKNQEIIKQNITAKYEGQLENLKSQMKTLYNRELAKHKTEQTKENHDLREQNKAYKEHIDELRNQLWDLGEKLLQEQKTKRDLERNFRDLKKKFERTIFPAEHDSKSSYGSDFLHHKEAIAEETAMVLSGRQPTSSAFPTMPIEDEDEVFDNRCLEDMKLGLCRVEGPEGRLTELQFRNSMCLPHLKSSYPAETQFHNPRMYREQDLRLGNLHFGQESQSLTDSDHSMTRSLLPDDRGKKKEQTSYKRPGPPTPSKNGGRLSLQSGELRLTPKNVLRESNDADRSRGTPKGLKSLFSSRSSKRDSIGCKDENSAPGTPRGKKLKIFRPRKPFGGRDY